MAAWNKEFRDKLRGVAQISLPRLGVDGYEALFDYIDDLEASLEHMTGEIAMPLSARWRARTTMNCADTIPMYECTVVFCGSCLENMRPGACTTPGCFNHPGTARRVEIGRYLYAVEPPPFEGSGSDESF